jgi:hypothetical protein
VFEKKKSTEDRSGGSEGGRVSEQESRGQWRCEAAYSHRLSCTQHLPIAITHSTCSFIVPAGSLVDLCGVWIVAMLSLSAPSRHPRGTDATRHMRLRVHKVSSFRHPLRFPCESDLTVEPLARAALPLRRRWPMDQRVRWLSMSRTTRTRAQSLVSISIV